IVSKVVGKTPAAAPPTPGAELTVIALTLGMIALAIAWPFRQGFLAMALSGLGLMLAGVMVAPLAWRKAPGLGLPVTALLINLQGFLLAVVFCATDRSAARDPSYPPIASLRQGLGSTDAATRVEAITQFAGLL